MRDMGKLLRPRTHVAASMWAGAAALLALAAAIGSESYVLLDALRREEAAVARLQAPARPASPPPVSREDRERERRLSALHAERGFRWYPVFKGLEQASGDEIELLEFAPDKVNRTFVLRGEAKDTEALLAYLSALSEQEGFSGVYLAHQKQGKRGSLAIQEFEVHGRIRQ